MPNILTSRFQIPYFNNKKGFTLIELMIAISIIAIISAVGITTYSQAQKLARDSKRKADLRAIAVALELYNQKYGHYPCVVGAGGGWLYSGTAPSTWITNSPSDCATGTALDNNFISQVPIDPLNQSDSTPHTGNTTIGYGYFGAGFSIGGCNKPVGTSYILVAGLENASDPETIGNKTYKFCDGTPINPGQGYGTNKFVITSW